jgi:hypothetical protein
MSHSTTGSTYRGIFTNKLPFAIRALDNQFGTTLEDGGLGEDVNGPLVAHARPVLRLLKVPARQHALYEGVKECTVKKRRACVELDFAAHKLEEATAVLANLAGLLAEPRSWQPSLRCNVDGLPYEKDMEGPMNRPARKTEAATDLGDRVVVLGDEPRVLSGKHRGDLRGVLRRVGYLPLAQQLLQPRPQWQPARATGFAHGGHAQIGHAVGLRGRQCRQLPRAFRCVLRSETREKLAGKIEKNKQMKKR